MTAKKYSTEIKGDSIASVTDCELMFSCFKYLQKSIEINMQCL